MLTLYNTLERKKQSLKPIKAKRVTLFVCGPTVYDFSHLGHARTYIFFDVLVKYLRQQGFDVRYLQNITDIDDKIINRAKKSNITPKVLARRFEREYMRDMKSLRVNAVTEYAKATDYIPEIIEQVQKLIKKGFAYKAADGIYYDIKKFKNYGKLSGRTALQAEDAASRIDECREKRNKGDFCLWKLSKPGEPRWKSPFGAGRPGWHIEDTAITEKFFGFSYDIHGGAQDLLFPHHEAEIAQMEALSGKRPMARNWLHTGLLTVQGKKMAKSLGNFVTIRDFLEQHSARTLRLFFLKSHWRSFVNYTEKAIVQTERELERIDEFLLKITRIAKKERTTTPLSPLVVKLISRTRKRIDGSLENNFNTPLVLSALFDFITAGNKFLGANKITSTDARDILVFLQEYDRFLTFLFWKPKKVLPIPKTIKDIVKQREQFRKQKKWRETDALRKKVERLGYTIEDTNEGPIIKKQKA